MTKRAQGSLVESSGPPPTDRDRGKVDGEGRGVGWDREEEEEEARGESSRRPQGTCTSLSHHLSSLIGLLCSARPHSVLPMGPLFLTRLPRSSLHSYCVPGTALHSEDTRECDRVAMAPCVGRHH